MKKTIIIERLRGAWAALRAKPYNMATVEIGMQRCDECDYYKRATEPAETAEITETAKKAPTWTDGHLPYYHEITYMDDIVQVVLYEATEDGAVELTRRYGQILHEGAKGIAQATSYAMRGVWEHMRSE